MAKKYSSLRSLASGSGTPYGVKKDNTSNSNTFNLPSVIEKIPSSKSRGGKSIHDYVTNPQMAFGPTGGCNSKYIQITSGEYSLGSIDIGQYAADAFKTNNGGGWPVCIRVDKGTKDALNQPNNNTTYNEVSYISDITGDALAASAVLLQGTDVLPNDSAFILVYQGHGGTIGLHAQERTIRVAWDVSGVWETKDFQVILPGVQNTVGWGDSMASMANLNSSGPGLNSFNIDCQDPSYQQNLHTVDFHGHFFPNAPSNVYLYGNSTPYFFGTGPLGAGNTGFSSLHVTRLGQHHNNTGLWNEGFQPDDGGSGGTNAHQETWPVGLFYDTQSTLNERNILKYYSTSGGGAPQATIRDLYEKQYIGSALTNTTHLSIHKGNPLLADSVQHYEYIQTFLVNDSAKSTNHPKDYLNQIENSQANYPTSNSSTFTSDDNGTNFGIIKGELIAGSGSILYSSTNTLTSFPTGGADGMIANATGENHVPTFQHIQIYSENLACSCGGSSGGSTPIDMCTDANSPHYYLYSGVDCTGDAIPVGLMNGTETWGPNGSTGYTYELVANSVCYGCDCSGPIPSFSFANITAPTTQGGNDGWADIEIDPANSGDEGWAYLVEPLANTSAGLGRGAVDTMSAVSASSGLNANGNWTFTYLSGSSSGDHLQLVFQVSNYNTSPVFTLNKFKNRGKGFVIGEAITLEAFPGGPSITLTVTSVTGVPVLIQGATNVPHYADPTNCANQTPTASGGLIATIGTDVFLQHTGVANDTNNYAWAWINGHNLPTIPGLPFKDATLFNAYPFGNSTGNNYPITGMEAGSYKVTVLESGGCGAESMGCFEQQTLVIPPGVASTNGCTDNNAGTNDGTALNYDANATVDDDSCIYCRAADGKLVDFQSNELTVSGSNNPGDIFTSTNNSTTIAATTSVATDGSIAYTRTLNSIMNYYAGQIVDANGTANAEFKMELYSCVSSTQTLTGASQVGATVTTPTSVGFNYDFDSINFSQGLTYGYYAIKSYVDDPDSASEQEQCFQVDYFIVPVLACITGVPGMQVGITTDGVTITDLDLVVASIPGNNLNPCTTQCCDDPTATVGYAPAGPTPGCVNPYFNVSQTCPAGNLDYVTTVTAEIQKLINGVWTTVISNVNSAPTFAPGATIFGVTYVVTVYWQHGPGDYRTNHILDYTWPNGTTTQCESHTNVITLNSPICGCTDPNSLNFNPLATIDDGSCTYCVWGCMDPDAPNYNQLATCDDGSCISCIYGCMDPAANNYNSAATCDDGSCQYGVGCGCTDVLADNYGEDCGGNIVGYPPPCDDGCCSYGGVFCANPPNMSTVTTESTCDPVCGPGAVGCTANLNGVSGGPGYFSIDLDFGTDKGVCILTFNTGHSNTITAPLQISVPDKLGWSFDIDGSGIQTTRSEQSALVGGYLTGLVGTPNMSGYCPGSGSCSGTPGGNVTEYVYSASSGSFVSTTSTIALPAYGGNSTGDMTLTDWAVSGNVVPNKGNTPNHLTVFNEDGHINRNGVAYIPVPPSTSATSAKVFVEAPCDSTWWGLTIRCPELLTGISSSVSAGIGGDPSSLGLTTTIYHIPIDANGAGNPNSAYWNGTGFGTGQLAGTLGKHDWVFTDPYGENKLPAGNYLMESPVGSGITWDVTVGVPTYNDDANCAAPPSGSTQDGVVLMMETVSPANPCVGTTSIPDSNWETALIAQGLDSGPVDGSISNANICNEFMINNPSAGITNITGIEGFVSVEAVHLQGNNITSIDFPALGVGVSLSNIHVANNSNLTTLVLPTVTNYMVSINAGACALTTLDASNQPQLTHVRINSNNFTTVGSSGLILTNSPNIHYIKMHNNNIAGTVDLSANLVTDFYIGTIVYCQDNDISELNLGDTIDLVELASQDAAGLERFDARNNNASLVIKVGSIARKAQAQALFVVGTHIDATTTFSEL
jgi:hypothetical protein